MCFLGEIRIACGDQQQQKLKEPKRKDVKFIVAHSFFTNFPLETMIIDMNSRAPKNVRSEATSSNQSNFSFVLKFLSEIIENHDNYYQLHSVDVFESNLTSHFTLLRNKDCTLNTKLLELKLNVLSITL